MTERNRLTPDPFKDGRMLKAEIIRMGRLETPHREQAQSEPVTSQPSEQPTNIVYQCHCPRCQGLLESTKDFYGMIFFECVCGCGFKLYKDWTKKVPWSDSFTGHIQGVLDARD